MIVQLLMGMFQDNARVFAVITPMRVLVNEPGPVSTWITEGTLQASSF